MDEKIIDGKTIQNIETMMAKATANILEKNNIFYSLAYGSVLGAIRHNGPIPWDLDFDMYIRFDDLWNVIKVLRDNLPDPFTVDYYDTNPKYRLIYPRVALKNSSSDLVHIDLFGIYGLPSDKPKRITFWKKIMRANLIYYRYKNRTYYVRKENRAKWKYNVAYCQAKIVEIFYLPISKKYLRKKLTKLFSKYPIDDASFVAGDPCVLSDPIEKNFILPVIVHDYNKMTLKIPKEYDAYLKHCYRDYMIFPDQKLIDERLTLTTNISKTDYKKIINS